MSIKGQRVRLFVLVVTCICAVAIVVFCILGPAFVTLPLEQLGLGPCDETEFSRVLVRSEREFPYTGRLGAYYVVRYVWVCRLDATEGRRELFLKCHECCKRAGWSQSVRFPEAQPWSELQDETLEWMYRRHNRSEIFPVVRLKIAPIEKPTRDCRITVESWNISRVRNLQLNWWREI